MLSFVIFVPLLTALAILLVPGNYRFVIRCLALLGTLESAIWGSVLFFQFVPGGEGLQFEQVLPWVSSGGVKINYHVGLDGLNVGLVFAAAWVGFAAVCVSWEVERGAKLFYVLLLLMISGAIGAFAAWDLFFFYFFNELALIPTFILIGVWGRGVQKNYAAYQMTLYLTAGALVALIGLIGLYAKSGANTLDLIELRSYLAQHPLSKEVQMFLFPCLLFGFGTLVGLWPFHSWAPLGYAAAPSGVAMMHAGILKKAGLLALLRVAMPLMPQGVAFWMPILAWLALGNLLYCGWVAMKQRDLNLLIGNSSLAHMGFAFLGIASVSVIGITGTVLVMVAHAFLAGLSFAISGWISRATGTTYMDEMGGLMKRLPFVGGAMVACFMAGCGLPGFANFPGEMSILFGAWHSFPGWVIAAAWSGLLIGGIYMLRAIRLVMHGTLNAKWTEIRDASDEWRQLPFVILFLGLLLFGCFPNLLVRRITPAAQDVVAGATGKPLVVLSTRSIPTTAPSVGNHPH